MEDRSAFDYNLECENGLLAMKLSYPTDEEVKTLPTVWLTNDNPWDPCLLDVEDREILPWWTPSDGGELLMDISHARLDNVDQFA